MSSHDKSASRRLVLLAAVLGIGLAAAGCTVRPLYSTASIGGPLTGDAAKLASIGVKPVDTRYAQQVRNQLIFLLGGGAGEPAKPAYELAMKVTSQTTSAAYVPVTGNPYDNAGVPTAGTVTLTAQYTLTDTTTSKTVASGRRNAIASFDRPRQQYATVTAENDAQDRAARELAEQLHLAIAQDLSH